MFTTYINEMFLFHKENIAELLINEYKLLYIRIEKLITVRKVDEEQQHYILFFLFQSCLLCNDQHYLLCEAHFRRIEMEYGECQFTKAYIWDVSFQEASFRWWIFMISTFQEANFSHVHLTQSFSFVSPYSTVLSLITLIFNTLSSTLRRLLAVHWVWLIFVVLSFHQFDYTIETSNLVRAIRCSDKKRGDRMCTIRYDVYSNSLFSKCIISLIYILFRIRVHEVKLDRTEQNEQYLIGQSIVTSNEWYISLGTTMSI
jgi:hypothetical protein